MGEEGCAPVEAWGSAAQRTPGERAEGRDLLSLLSGGDSDAAALRSLRRVS